MSNLSRPESVASDSSSYNGPASPTLVDEVLEEFPPPQPGAFLSRPGVPRLLTPAPHAPVPAGPATAENHLLALGQMSPPIRPRRHRQPRPPRRHLSLHHQRARRHLRGSHPPPQPRARCPRSGQQKEVG